MVMLIASEISFFFFFFYQEISKHLARTAKGLRSVLLSQSKAWYGRHLHHPEAKRCRNRPCTLFYPLNAACYIGDSTATSAGDLYPTQISLALLPGSWTLAAERTKLGGDGLRAFLEKKPPPLRFLASARAGSGSTEIPLQRAIPGLTLNIPLPCG